MTFGSKSTKSCLWITYLLEKDNEQDTVPLCVVAITLNLGTRLGLSPRAILLKTEYN